MVVQGANDPRVKKAESDQIVVAMRELGLPVEYLCAPDEGHGFRRPENNMAFLAAAEKFLAMHLGGRYQAEMPDNIAKRLEEITVDINTVTLPEKVDASKLAGDLPKPTTDLTAGNSTYKMTINMGGQEFPMEVTQTIDEKDGKWVITQTSTSTMGSMTDISTLEKGSLQPVSRNIEQGPVSVQLDHSKEMVSGKMSMNGNEQTLEIALDKPIFADGAALYETLATLPLEKGYKAVYRSLDVQGQKVKSFELEVVDMESIQVPAGTFQTYKTSIKELGDTPGDVLLWLSTEDGKRGLIKSTATVAQMGGAKVTVELSEK